MFDLNSKNVTEDTVQIPDQLDEVVPLTPVQIFIKGEEIVPDQLGEVVPLTPVQIYFKEEVSCKTEEPVLVSLLPVIQKEDCLVDALPDDFDEGSDALVINLENSSSEEWSNQSDPLAIEPNEAQLSYVEYVENSDAILLDLGAASTEDSLHTLRVTQEVASTVNNGELYDLMGCDKIVQVSENGSVSPDGDTDSECFDILDVPMEPYSCGYCSASFTNEGEMQMHTLSHMSKAARRYEVPQAPEVKCGISQVAEAKPKPVRVLRGQHTCGDCGATYNRLQHLMRHRLGHLRTALKKPFSTLKLSSLQKPQVPVSAVSDSRRTATGVPSRSSPKRSARRSAITPQPERRGRRKETHRRRVS